MHSMDLANRSEMATHFKANILMGRGQKEN